MYDWLGWAATALFTLSYFVRGERNLLKPQATAATGWCAYGIMLSRPPLIVANVIVALSASFSAWRHWDRERREERAKAATV
jgi:hypothetical protein